MPFIFLALLIGLPIIDIQVTLRFAEALGVPGILLFLPGVVAGSVVFVRETKQLRTRLVGAIQSLSLHAAVFDSGRRMIAALFFLSPGVGSDLFAALLMLMPNRAMAIGGSPASASSARSPSDSRAASGTPNVVDAEFRRVE